MTGSDQTGGAEADSELKPLRRTAAYLTRSRVTWRQAVEGSATVSVGTLGLGAVALVLAIRRWRRA